MTAFIATYWPLAVVLVTTAMAALVAWNTPMAGEE